MGVGNARNRTWLLPALAGLLGLGCLDGIPPGPQRPFTAETQWIEDHALAFTATTPGAPDGDLQGLVPMLGGATLIGLGEATHGSRECFRMKHRLLRQLVTQHGVTAFGLEADLAACRALNEYVMTGQGHAETLLKDLGVWPWAVEEVAELFEWLRAHNAASPPERQVHCFGFDLQDGAAALAQLKAYLATAAPEDGRAVAKLFEPYRPFLGPRKASYAQAPAATRDLCPFNLQLARRWLLTHQAELVEAAGAQAHAWAVRMATLLIQHEALGRLAERLAERLAVQPPTLAALNLRDRFMADNVDWAVQQLGPGTRAVLWSHNGHINRQASGAGRVAMGHWLAARHGPAYLAVGFAFGAGGFQAVPVDDNGSPGWLQPFDLPRPAPEACETALLASGLPNAILNLRNLDLTRTGARWFHEPHPLREVGDRYPAREAFTPGAAVLASRFDLLVFLRTVTPSRPLERRQGPQTFRERF